MPYIETSAKESTNIEELFKMALQNYMTQLNSKPIRKNNSSFVSGARSISLDKNTMENNDFCCIKFS
jgi:hypothetical protein